MSGSNNRNPKNLQSNQSSALTTRLRAETETDTQRQLTEARKRAKELKEKRSNAASKVSQMMSNYTPRTRGALTDYADAVETQTGNSLSSSGSYTIKERTDEYAKMNEKRKKAKEALRKKGETDKDKKLDKVRGASRENATANKELKDNKEQQGRLESQLKAQQQYSKGRDR
jgi:hypothetical protein